VVFTLLIALALCSAPEALASTACYAPMEPSSASEIDGGGPAFALASGGGDSDSQQDKQKSEQVLARYINGSSRTVARGVSMMSRFVGGLPEMGKTAVLEAKRKILPDGAIEYEVLSREGDKTVQKDIIARYMSAEMDAAMHQTSNMGISPENYKFKNKGLQMREGKQVCVVEVNPRKKRVGLFKGEIWLDPDSGLTVREAGRFVKSPSVFLKKVEFARTYEVRDGYAIPVSMTTAILTRLWGTAELMVQYRDFNWDQPPVQATQTVTHAAADNN
jgi:hypothetical protein